MSMNRYEQQFYEQFSKFQINFKKSVELQKEAIALQEAQNEILAGIYYRLAPKPKDTPPPEPPKPVTGVPQIDAVLAKQKARQKA